MELNWASTWVSCIPIYTSNIDINLIENSVLIRYLTRVIFPVLENAVLAEELLWDAPGTGLLQAGEKDTTPQALLRPPLRSGDTTAVRLVLLSPPLQTTSITATSTRSQRKEDKRRKPLSTIMSYSITIASTYQDNKLGQFQINWIGLNVI